MLMRWIVFWLMLAAASGVVQAQAQAQTPAAAGAVAAPGTPSRAAAAEDDIAPEMAIVQALQTVLKGYSFNKRLETMNRDDHWLLFSRGDADVALVGWTTSNATDHVALAPAAPMRFIAYNYKGEVLGTVATVDMQIGLPLGRVPKVLVPSAPNVLLQIAAQAQTVQGEMVVKGPQMLELTCTFVNPTSEILLMPVPDMNRSIAVEPGGSTKVTRKIRVGRSMEPIYTTIGAMGIEQPVTIVVENPLEIVLRAEEPRVLMLEVLNPSGEAFKAEAVFNLGQGGEPFRFPLEFRSNQRLNSLRIPLGADLPLPATLTVSIEQTIGSGLEKEVYVLAQTGALQFAPILNFSNTGKDGAPAGYKFVEHGGVTAVVRGGTPDKIAVPWPERGTLDIFYDFGQRAERGERVWFAIEPENPATTQLLGQPSEIGFWLHGDGSGNTMRMAWRDSSGKEYFSSPRALDWEGWRYVSFDIPQGMAAPVQLSTLLRVDSSEPVTLRNRQGHLLANGFCLTYGLNHARPAYIEEAPASTAPSVPAEVTDSEIIRGTPVRFKQAPGEPERLPARPVN